MRIVPGDPADRVLTQSCFEVLRAADETDDPHGPPWSLRRLRAWLEYPAEPARLVIADDGAGAVTGLYYLVLPERENRDRAYLYLTVHPAARRRGTGTAPGASLSPPGPPPAGRRGPATALLRPAAGQAPADGRAVLGGAALQGS